MPTTRARKPAATPETPPRKEVGVRRAPRQARSQEKVDRILAAAGREVEEGGLDRLTTNRIAAAAGLSVGTVYDYFPNKESIVGALLDGWLARIFEAVDGAHPRHGTGLDLLSYIRETVERCARLYEEQPGLSVLFAMVPAVPALRDATLAHDEAIFRTHVTALQHYAPHAPLPDVEAISRCIPLMAHDILTAAIVHKQGDRQKLMNYLYVALMAMASRVLIA
ncbi:TetR/AcrR family transcriptional regulator [Pelomonas sp. KK5]|uniref:TetR/AcrR family transcriptional regulator n=1 Tax=Pelomonas sp. KK5 TaxID=1855730 RepID=UPI00097C5D6A|nr:TetR/AcrR family transcriptional regulator [Pelomonas sp. KK5]